MKGNFIVFDCETGGLSKDENPITEIALLGVDVDMKEITRFSTYVKPYGDLKITKKALEKTMVSMKDINNGMSLEDMVDVVIKFIKKVKGGSRSPIKKPVLVGHNVPFDVAMFKKAFQLCKKDLTDYVSHNNGEILIIDTLQLARLIWGVGLKDSESDVWTLKKCCERAGIEIIDAHGAMNDTLVTWMLLKYFTTLNKQSSINTEEIKQERTRDFFKIG